MGDYVGLNIGDDGTEEPPNCPDCGEPLEQVPFGVDTPSPEVAMRVFLAWEATKHIPTSQLEAVVRGTAHLYLEQCDGGCTSA